MLSDLLRSAGAHPCYSYTKCCLAEAGVAGRRSQGFLGESQSETVYNSEPRGGAWLWRCKIPTSSDIRFRSCFSWQLEQKKLLFYVVLRAVVAPAGVGVWIPWVQKTLFIPSLHADVVWVIASGLPVYQCYIMLHGPCLFLAGRWCCLFVTAPFHQWPYGGFHKWWVPPTKSFILARFSIMNHQFWGPHGCHHFWKPPCTEDDSNRWTRMVGGVHSIWSILLIFTTCLAATTGSRSSLSPFQMRLGIFGATFGNGHSLYVSCILVLFFG